MHDPFEDITPDESLFAPDDIELAEWMSKQRVASDWGDEIVFDNHPLIWRKEE